VVVFRQKQNIDVRIRHEVTEVDQHNKRIKVKEMEISRTGLSEKEVKNQRIDYQAETITSVSPADYYPGSEKISVKLLVNKQTQRILGGQIVGFKGAAKRIDTIVTAITAGFTVQQLMDLDLAYAPLFSTACDPVQIAARRLRSLKCLL
jgi:pyruvate/2-oxoglutarate dehydrogenase complex dihydrolipoamide dehydrogenase (E3) component